MGLPKGKTQVAHVTGPGDRAASGDKNGSPPSAAQTKGGIPVVKHACAGRHSPKPLWVVGGRVKPGGGFEQLELAGGGGLGRLVEQIGNLLCG